MAAFATTSICKVVRIFKPRSTRRFFFVTCLPSSLSFIVSSPFALARNPCSYCEHERSNRIPAGFVFACDPFVGERTQV